MKMKMNGITALSLSALMLWGLSGCQPPPQERVAVLVSGDLEPDNKSVDKKNNNDVYTEDIESLQVTLTEIVLDQANTPPLSPGEGEEAAGGKIVVFSGSVDLEMRDLIGVSELISEADIPAGRYTKIRLAIENPRLTLVSDPETVITDIQTTANGHLFVSEEFEVPAGQDSLILLDFQGLHLVKTGNGKYVWTPQLRAEISVEAADVQVQGAIESVDTEADTLMLLPDSGTEALPVDYAAAAIYLPDDTDTATGTEADLVPGTAVIVEGELSVSGEITAAAVWILPST